MGGIYSFDNAHNIAMDIIKFIKKEGYMISMQQELTINAFLEACYHEVLHEETDDFSGHVVLYTSLYSRTFTYVFEENFIRAYAVFQ